MNSVFRLRSVLHVALALCVLVFGCHEDPVAPDAAVVDMPRAEVFSDQPTADVPSTEDTRPADDIHAMGDAPTDARDGGTPDAGDARVDVTFDVRSDTADSGLASIPESDVPRSLELRIDAAAVPADVPYPDAADGGMAVAPPRPIAPLSAMRVTTQRPTLRWELPAGVTGARVELCGDPLCRYSVIRTDVVGTNFRPVSALPPGVIFWRLAGLNETGVGTRWSPTWEFGVRRSDTPVDSTVGLLKDFNGDGFDDLVVTENDRGRVDVLLGGTSGVNESTRRTFLTFPVLPRLSGGGDINLDGLADLTVSSLVFFGSPSGIPEIPDVNLVRPPEFVGRSAIADVNGDGLGDVIGGVGAAAGRNAVYIIPGVTSGISTSLLRTVSVDEEGQFWPESLDGVGDFNGDGYGDAVVGSYRTAGRRGRVYLLLGGADGLSGARTVRYENPGGAFSQDFGYALAGVGDLNGDTLSDFIVSGSLNTIYVYYGRRELSSTRPDVTIVQPDSTQSASGFNSHLTHGGDVNSDGFGDLLLGPGCQGRMVEGEFFCTESRSYLYFGRSTGLAAVPDVVFRGLTDAADVGYVTPGDLNGDGVDDFVIGDAIDSGPGRLDVFFGRSDSVFGVPSQIIVSTSRTGRYGLFMAMNFGFRSPII